MKPNVIDLNLLLSVPYVDPDLGFDLSEDGSKITFSWNRSGQWEIYVLELDHFLATGKTLIHQIIGGDGAKFSPQWVPAKNQLSYVVDYGGSENYDIYVYDFDLRNAVNLTPNTSYAIAPQYAWSPDGQLIAFCSAQDGQFNTYLMNYPDRSVKKVLDHPFPDWQVSWAPDGKYIAVVSEATGQDNWITVVTVDSGDHYLIGYGNQPIPAKEPCWSPNGQLAFTSDKSGVHQVYILDLRSRNLQRITSGVGDKEHPDWSSRGDLAYVIRNGPNCELGVETDNGQTKGIYQISPGVINTPKFSPSGDAVFIVFNNPKNPCDIWFFSLKELIFQQVTSSLPDGIVQNKLVMPEEISYQSLDGEEVPGLLYHPESKESANEEEGDITADRGLLPGIINIHGGPNWISQVSWDPLIQHMVSRGWVVLCPNYRGSTGYGKEWQLANRFDLGGIDTKDVVSGALFLTAENIAVPDRIAVTGRSWGGYLTLTCLTQFPEKWAAGSAIVPFLNWFTSHKNSREDLQHWDLENFGDPVQNWELWHDRSPYFFLDRICAPVQLICGAQDVRCPASESLDAYNKLKELGKDCEYYIYLDEGHQFMKTKNLIQSKIQQVNFLSKYLDERNS
jgi:dipeptidyl aminopeptidase/acylaminoacyl peptidase